MFVAQTLIRLLDVTALTVAPLAIQAPLAQAGDGAAALALMRDEAMARLSGIGRVRSLLLPRCGRYWGLRRGMAKAWTSCDRSTSGRAWPMMTDAPRGPRPKRRPPICRCRHGWARICPRALAVSDHRSGGRSCGEAVACGPLLAEK